MKPIQGKVKIGVVGLGARGVGQLSMLLSMEDAEVVSICDVLEFRVNEGMKIAQNAGNTLVKGYSDYRELIDAGGIDALLVFTSWQTHIRIAVKAMRAGIYVATEVGGATSIEECWSLSVPMRRRECHA